MKKIIHLTIFVALFSISFSSCQNSKKDASIVIIQTTDVHGSIFPYDFIKDKPSEGSLANVYTYVKSMREKNPTGVILLDNGDYFQGQPSVYYYNYEDTSSSHLGTDILNYMEYDAMSVGNHDIECGHPVYDKLRTNMNFPWLAANAIDTKTGEPYFTPYTIIEREGIRIAVLGLITPAIPDWLPESIWEGMEFEDMVESAKKWVKIIQEKENPDLLIGLFHAGIDYEYNNQTKDTYKNENATLLVAEQVPGFDIVMGGHDHKKFNKKVMNTAGDTVYLLDPQSHGKAVASIQIDFSYNKKDNKWNKNILPSIVEMKDYKPDKAFLSKFDSEFNAVKSYVSRQVGELNNILTTKDSYFGNSAFIDLIHKVQLQNTTAKISFSAPLSFNSSIEKGPIYVRDLFNLYKYENLLYTITLSGSEIDSYLEFSAGLWFNQMRNRNDHLLLLTEKEDGKFSLENQYFNFSSASGIEYVVDVSKPIGNKVKILGFSDGSWFYKDSIYQVALNSYRGNGGGGHLTEGVGLSSQEIKERLVSTSDYDLRFLLMNYLEKEKEITPKAGRNWRVIPEDYYEWGKNKDYKLLFK